MPVHMPRGLTSLSVSFDSSEEASCVRADTRFPGVSREVTMDFDLVGPEAPERLVKAAKELHEATQEAIDALVKSWGS